MDNEVKRKQDAQIKLQKEINEFISQKLGNKKFFGVITYHQETVVAKDGINSTYFNGNLLITNINAGSDSFDLVKNIIINFKGFSDQLVNTFMGHIPVQQIQNTVQDYQ